MGIHRLIDFLKSCFLNRPLDDQEFKQEYWSNIKNRRYYIRAIIENPEYRGKTKSQIKAYFGNNECRHMYINRWTYFIEIKKNKEYMLAFYFEDNILIDIRYEFKYIT